MALSPSLLKLAMNKAELGGRYPRGLRSLNKPGQGVIWEYVLVLKHSFALRAAFPSCGTKGCPQPGGQVGDPEKGPALRIKSFWNHIKCVFG